MEHGFLVGNIMGGRNVRGEAHVREQLAKRHIHAHLSSQLLSYAVVYCLDQACEVLAINFG